MAQRNAGHVAILHGSHSNDDLGPGYFHLASWESQNPLLLTSLLEDKVCGEGTSTLLCLRLERMQTSFNFTPAGASHMHPPRYMRTEKYGEAHFVSEDIFGVPTLSAISLKN